MLPNPGSSPRAGRRPEPVPPLAQRRRLIPAGGETTFANYPINYENWAHPRGRGDDRLFRSTLCRASGSSPRAGRRPTRLLREAHDARLIPAGGETTSEPKTSSSDVTAHPRGRGDDKLNLPGPTDQWGSSPRAGRRLRHVVHERGGVGLIPAGGETTAQTRRRSTWLWAHPRGRGDDVGGVPRSQTCGGSSPRAGRRPSARGVPPGAEVGSSPRAGRRRHLRKRGAGRRGLIPAGGETTLVDLRLCQSLHQIGITFDADAVPPDSTHASASGRRRPRRSVAACV